MAEPLLHRVQGRNPRTAIGVGIALAVLVGLNAVGTMPWILVLLLLLTVPAIVELIRNPTGTFELNDTEMCWKNSGQTAEVPLSRIQKARFDTRWDFSVRVTLKMIDNSKLRIPQDVMPPHVALETALKERGIATERHHFRVI